MSFSHLDSWIGKTVRINRGGPDSVTGGLLAVQSDHLVLQTSDSVIYINSSHVKSVSEIAGSSNEYDCDSEYVSADSFSSLLQNLKHSFVQINRGGPEKLEGFLADVSDDHLMLVVNQEIIRVPTFHVKSVSVAFKSSGSSGNKSSSYNKSSYNKSSYNKSSSHQSDGNKSSNRSSSHRSSYRSSGYNYYDNKSSRRKRYSSKRSSSKRSSYKRSSYKRSGSGRTYRRRSGSKRSN